MSRRLLAFFAIHFFIVNPSYAGQESIDKWITDLGSKSYRTRQKATANLTKVGAPAMPGLVKAATSGVLETRRRAMNILEGFLFSKEKDIRAKAEELFVALAKDEKSGMSDRAYALLVRLDTKSLAGVLNKQDPFDKVRKKMHHKAHVFSFKKGNRFTIDLEGPFDTYLRLEDANGRQLMQDDDGGVGLNSRMAFTPNVDGKYRVIVTTFGQGATGPYSLTVRKFRMFRKSVLQGFNDQLTKKDPFDRLRAKNHCKIYKIKLMAGRTYTIDLQGNFDTYLRLENSKRVNLAEDDDGGSGLNSRLQFRPITTGEYRIIVTTFSAGATGNYNLSVERGR